LRRARFACEARQALIQSSIYVANNIESEETFSNLMSSSDFKNQQREIAARRALNDISYLVQKAEEGSSADPDEPRGRDVVALLRKNYRRLDKNKNGISREELTQALMRPGEFSKDEYVMLQLLNKYFDTIANLSKDEDGPETVISRMDCAVLAQFLMHSDLTLSQLHQWVGMTRPTRITDQDIGPPPLSG
jgi:hypothetical protein